MALNYDRIMAYRPADIAVNYGPRDCILYALGIGLGMDPLDPGQLKFVYERGLEAFPTMAGVLGWPGRMTDPAFGLDETMVVAAELKVTLARPLAPADDLVSRPRIKEVVDRGPSGPAIVLARRELLARDGTPVACVESNLLARKHGGFGGRVTTLPEPPAIPDGPPTRICDLPTPPNLALLYRLTGDENPLHADPQRAKAAGFPQPILHGAATFGIAAHAILRQLDYRPDRLASISARFSRPVFPGETIRTEIWSEPGRISFQCRVVGRDEIVLTNGLATLRD
ncbi:MAG: MaoC/PaaZ C-terminal domain-containing protein [Rhodoplanes sp.]